MLTCTHCLTERNDVLESSINFATCDTRDEIGNRNGVLVCQPAPEEEDDDEDKSEL